MASDRLQMVGTQMEGMGSRPADETMDTFSGGTIQDSETGRVPLSRSNSPLGVFSDQSMGEVQFTGDKMSLNRTPHRGYESGTVANQQTKLPDTTESF